MGHKVEREVDAMRGLLNALGFGGSGTMELWRGGQCIAEGLFKNDIVNVGLNKNLDVMFNGDTQITTWYMGLFIDGGTLMDSDTMSSNGWTEFTAYSQANRPTWNPGSAASQSITNSTPIEFSITGTGTIGGIFITSDNAKGMTAGTLWATAPFGTAQPVMANDTLRVTYTLNAAHA